MDTLTRSAQVEGLLRPGAAGDAAASVSFIPSSHLRLLGCCWLSTEGIWGGKSGILMLEIPPAPRFAVDVRVEVSGQGWEDNPRAVSASKPWRGVHWQWEGHHVEMKKCGL